MLSPVVFSSKSDHWSTPPDVYGALDQEFGFTFDPCPLMATEDGRKSKWTGRVFCNPPYSAIDEFLRKGLWHLCAPAASPSTESASEHDEAPSK